MKPLPLPRQRRGFAFCLACLAVLGPGCALPVAPPHGPAADSPHSQATAEPLAQGVLHRALPVGSGGVDLIDIDRSRTTARPAVVARGITRTRGLVVGQTGTPEEWLSRTRALACTNGGYFGVDDGQGRRQFVGLLVQGGRVRHAAPPLYGHGGARTAPGYYVRSAFGITAAGAPAIMWAATDPADPQVVRAYSTPLVAAGARGRRWRVREAVGCGPMLISDGRIVTSDVAERLVSPGPRPRTFVALDGPAGSASHFVLGIASGMTFDQLARFLRDYFVCYHHTRARDAMCLDGGASTQLAYRLGPGVQTPLATGVSVPDAVVILPR